MRRRTGVFHQRDIATGPSADEHDALVDHEREIRPLDRQLSGGRIIGPCFLLHSRGGLKLKRERPELDHVAIDQVGFPNLLPVDIHMGAAGEIADVNFALMADQQRMGLADLPGKQVQMCIMPRPDQSHRSHERDRWFAGVMPERNECRPGSLPRRLNLGDLTRRRPRRASGRGSRSRSLRLSG